MQDWLGFTRAVCLFREGELECRWNKLVARGNKFLSTLFGTAGLMLCATVSASNQPVSNPEAEIALVGEFSTISNDSFTPWRVINFDDDVPKTVFRKIRWDNFNAIKAEADASMALLARSIEVDLKAQPVLCWAWRVENMLVKADLNTQEGDDYAARVYIGLKDDMHRQSFFERVAKRVAKKKFGGVVPDYALTYIWDNRHPVGTQQANPYTDRTQLFVVAQGPQYMGRWVAARRHVLADVKQIFSQHENFRNKDDALMNLRPILLAIASDGDNTGEKVSAGFAHLHFVAEDAPCRFPVAIPMLPAP